MDSRFNKGNWTVKIYDGTRYFELGNSCNEIYWMINSRIYNAIFDGINFLICTGSGITDSIIPNFARIRTDSFNTEKNWLFIML